MDKGSSIMGGGKNITINVPNGDMTMHGTAGSDKCGYPTIPANSLGAQITSRPATIATTITINVGNYPNNTTPSGSFTMERCSVVSVSTGGSSAGTVVITAGHDTDIDGLVLSESTLSGTGAHQAPGGGPITVQTGCKLIVSSTGVVSSKGHDPGADLVHLEGCDVIIDGLVQSTGPGHVVPNNPANHCATGDHSGKARRARPAASRSSARTSPSATPARSTPTSARPRAAARSAPRGSTCTPMTTSS